MRKRRQKEVATQVVESAEGVEWFDVRVASTQTLQEVGAGRREMERGMDRLRKEFKVVYLTSSSNLMTITTYYSSKGKRETFEFSACSQSFDTVLFSDDR